MPNATTPAPDEDAATDTPAPLLDAKFLPHIMDMIVSYAPYETLLVMRGTNKSFKDRIDTLLSNHIIMLPVYSDRDTAQRMDAGEIFLTKRELRRLPSLQNGTITSASMRVLDVNGESGDLLRFVEPQPQSVAWLRTRGTTWHHYFCEDMKTAIRVHFLLDVAPSPPPETHYGAYLPTSVVKVVVNIEHDCIDLLSNPCGTLHIDYDKAADLQDVVIISKVDTNRNGDSNGAAVLSPRKRCVATGRAPRKVEKSLVHFFGSVAWQYWQAGASSITLVGFPLECIAPKLFTDNVLGSSPPSMEDARMSFLEDVHKWFDPMREEVPFDMVDELDEFIDQLEIIDHDTYRRRVGEEAYRLETVW